MGARSRLCLARSLAIGTRHAPCDDGEQRTGPDRNAAVHRWCRAEGFDSGLDPVESSRSGDTAVVTCVR